MTVVDFGKDISFGKKKKEQAQDSPTKTEKQTSGNPLKKEISFGRKKDAYPTKKSINLVVSGQTFASRYNAALLGALLFVLVVIFVKFAIFDPVATSMQTASQISAAQTELAALKSANASKSSTSQEYAHYVVPNLTSEETSLTPRSDIISLLKDKVVGFGSISSLKVVGNTVTVTCVNVGLQDLSTLVKSLENDARVSYVTVSTAQASEGKASSATVVITMKDANALSALQTSTTSSSTKGASNGQ